MLYDLHSADMSALDVYSTHRAMPPTPPLSPRVDAQPYCQHKSRRLRILALHGFGQDGEFFRAKLQRLQDHLETILGGRYPDGIEMVFPDGPVELVSDSTASPSQDVNMRAWWKTLDDTSLYPELPSSLASLAVLLRADPVDGIIGFSQGACTAMMLTALCEGTLERSAALKAQGAPITLQPPQAPFKFAIACCGFSGNPEHYSGFFEPKIRTPSLHLIADWDTMVSPEQSARLVRACADPEVVRHKGSHHVPTDSRHLNIMSNFVGRAHADSQFDSLLPRRWPWSSSTETSCDGPTGSECGVDGRKVEAYVSLIPTGILTPPLSTTSEDSKTLSSRPRWQFRRTRAICRIRRRA